MEGHEWVSLGGVGHVELSEGFFGLTVPTILKKWTPLFDAYSEKLDTILV